jgi:hypothetical protein
VKCRYIGVGVGAVEGAGAGVCIGAGADGSEGAWNQCINNIWNFKKLYWKRKTKPNVTFYVPLPHLTCNIFPVTKIRHKEVTPGQAVLTLEVEEYPSLQFVIIPEYCQSTS